ncbi:hypothetical protein, partial [Corallococcus interemptor]|uniref:hypothetical protein n=1 Tax=Corallococcus interemptor TaxID=2316720 RepID=UPI001ABEFDA3
MENKFFFHQHLDPPDSSFVSLPGFSENKSVVRFNLDFVYHRRNKEAPTGTTPLASPPASGPPLALGPSDHPSLRRSTRISVPPDHYGFSHTSL